MIEIVDIRYCRLGTANLKSAVDFATSMIGLEAAGVAVRRGSDDEATARRVMGIINLRGPTGNSVDLVVRPHHTGRRYFPS